MIGGFFLPNLFKVYRMGFIFILSYGMIIRTTPKLIMPYILVDLTNSSIVQEHHEIRYLIFRWKA